MISYVLLFSSLSLFLAGLLRHLELVRRYKVAITILTGCFAFVTGFFLVSDYFTGDGINASVFYHLQSGITGTGYSDYWQLILATITGLILFTSIPVLLIRFSERGGAKK